MTPHPDAKYRAPSASIYTLSSLGPILFITLIFFLTFVARVIISPLMPDIEGDLGISHTQSGSLFLYTSAGYFLGLIGSGYVSARIFHRNTITASALGVGVALCAVSISNGFTGLAVSVFVIGLAAGLYLPSGITTLTDMTAPNQWGKAISIHEIAPNLGFVAAPLIAEGMLLYFPWRIIPSFMGIFTVLMGIVFFFFAKGGRFPGKAPGTDAFRLLFSMGDFWIMVALFSLAISSTLGIYTMLPLYLISELEIPRNFANTLIAVSRVFGLFSALASGWAADRFGPRQTIFVTLGLTGLATVSIGFFNAPLAVTSLVFVQAVLATCYFPAGFALLSSIGPPGFRNVAVSMTIPFGFLFGGGVVPSVIGMTGDAGSFGFGIILVGTLVTGGAFLPLVLKTSRQSKK